MVPNAPCGVERKLSRIKAFALLLWFLMHRVELKDWFAILKGVLEIVVPNAPCGVERTAFIAEPPTLRIVPNAPCGVER